MSYTPEPDAEVIRANLVVLQKRLKKLQEEFGTHAELRERVQAAEQEARVQRARADRLQRELGEAREECKRQWRAGRDAAADVCNRNSSNTQWDVESRAGAAWSRDEIRAIPTPEHEASDE